MTTTLQPIAAKAIRDARRYNHRAIAAARSGKTDTAHGLRMFRNAAIREARWMQRSQVAA